MKSNITILQKKIFVFITKQPDKAVLLHYIWHFIIKTPSLPYRWNRNNSNVCALQSKHKLNYIKSLISKHNLDYTQSQAPFPQSSSWKHQSSIMNCIINNTSTSKKKKIETMNLQRQRLLSWETNTTSPLHHTSHFIIKTTPSLYNCTNSITVKNNL